MRFPPVSSSSGGIVHLSSLPWRTLPTKPLSSARGTLAAELSPEEFNRRSAEASENADSAVAAAQRELGIPNAEVRNCPG